MVFESSNFVVGEPCVRTTLTLYHVDDTLYQTTKERFDLLTVSWDVKVWTPTCRSLLLPTDSFLSLYSQVSSQ